MWGALAATVALALGACSVELQDGIYGCLDGRCPAGFFCHTDQLCWRAPELPDGGGSDSGGMDSSVDARRDDASTRDARTPEAGTPCTGISDCNDGNPCTGDACTGGMCAYFGLDGMAC